MNTRIQILPLLAITSGLAPLVGCDEAPADTDGIEETDTDIDIDTDIDADTDTDADLDIEDTDDTDAGPASFPAWPSSAERLVTTPEDEVMVSAAINLALGKPTLQSSTYSTAWASRAVDGDPDGNYDHGSVTHTDNPGENWWLVDLEAVAAVGEVVISNRTDCCSGRLHDFTVSVSSDLIHWEDFAHAGVASEKVRVLIDRPARWVKIKNPEVLSLAEVEVLRTQNLAFGKPTSQSSTAAGGDSARAVDGNTDGHYPHNSVTHTQDAAQQWWQVDLGTIQAIGHAVLFNRIDCCGERLHDFKLRVSDDGQHWFDIPFTGVAGSRVVVPVNREGRFVQVANGAGVLSLAEFQLFEAPRLPGLSYGRGVGTIPAAFGCGPGDEKNGLLCYPQCNTGFYGVGPVCWQACDPGFTDMGAYCMNYGVWGWPSYWKGSYGRGVGTPLVPACSPGMEYDAGLCYQPCQVGYKGVGPVCWLESLTIGSIATEACDRLRVPFMSALAGELGEALTFGVGLGVSVYAAASVELGLAYGSEGEFGCYISGCGGFTTGGLSIAAYVTAGLYSEFDDIAGASTVVSAGAAIGIPETPISFGGTASAVSNQSGIIGATVSASVSLGEPTPISFAVSEMFCETAVLQTQG